MIASATIEGFKSFGSPGTPVLLGPLNFIVGANGCGKTNFVSALQFIRLSLLHGLDHTVNNEFSGCREVRNRVLRERGEQKPCSFLLRLKEPKVNFEVTGGRRFAMSSVSYQLKADLRSDDSNPVVLEEHLNAELRAQDGATCTYTLDRNQSSVAVNDPTNPANPEKREVVHPQESVRLAVASGFFGLPALHFRELIAGWSFFSINAELARQAARETPFVELGPRGENLAAVLHEIDKKDGNGVMKGILNSLRGAVPRIKDIKPLRAEVEGKWTFQIVEERVRTLSPASVSDGTIRLLTLLVATYWSGRNSSLLVVEEPENNLHPHLYEQLVALFRAVSAERQIIVTTHSPGFLDFLKSDELLLCERDEETTFTRLVPASSRENIEIFRRKYTLGELWVQGALGGIPE